MKGVVSKETVVLRRCGSSIQKFGFINGVDGVNCHRTEVLLAFKISVRWPIYIINTVDKTQFRLTKMENPGIDPGTSRMQSGRSTI